MQIKSFCFFILFLLPALSATANDAELSAVDSIPWSKKVERLLRLEKLSTISPHYKNPNAAGRFTLTSQTVSTASRAEARSSLAGPAYKNSRKRAFTRSAKVAPVRSHRWVAGPRYKNRRVKKQSTRLISRWK